MVKWTEKSNDIWSSDSVRQINTPSLTAKKYLYYIQEAGYFKVKYPYYVERKDLDSFLVIFTLKGRGKLEKGGEKTYLDNGSCMFLDCNVENKYYALKNETWEFLWLHFYGSGSKAYYREFLKFNHPTVFIKNKEKFEKNMRMLLELQKLQTTVSEFEISLKITEILTEILLSCFKNTKSSNFETDYISKIKAYTENNYDEDLSLEKMSKKYCISKYHLSRQFKQCIGVNYTDFMLNTRISRAKEMLVSTNMSVGEITFKCGFKDESYFIRTFKAKENNMTPKEYRKYWKNKFLDD